MIRGMDNSMRRILVTSLPWNQMSDVTGKTKMELLLVLLVLSRVIPVLVNHLLRRQRRLIHRRLIRQRRKPIRQRRKLTPLLD